MKQKHLEMLSFHQRLLNKTPETAENVEDETNFLQS